MCRVLFKEQHLQRATIAVNLNVGFTQIVAEQDILQLRVILLESFEKKATIYKIKAMIISLN